MRRLALAVVVCAVMLAACGGDATVTTEGASTATTSATSISPSAPPGAPVIVGETPGYVDGWLEPYVGVAVGSDDIPMVVFYDHTTDVVEYRRCTDPRCVGQPVAAQIPVPEDQDLEWLSLRADPSDRPLIVLDGGSPEGTLVYLATCRDTECAQPLYARFPNEVNADVDFAPDGTLVMASTATAPGKVGAQALIMRRCGDSLCEQALSRSEIPVPSTNERWDLLLDPAGAPIAVSGGEVLSVLSCGDRTCASHDSFLTQTENPTDSLTAGTGDQPIVVYGSQFGVHAETWPGALGRESRSVLIDDTAADDRAFSQLGSLGSGGGPVVAYLRMLDIETEEESRQLIVAECTAADCSSGTRTVIARQDAGLETNPAVAVGPDGDTVIAFHTCPPGCAPQFINVLRCERGCAVALAEQIEADWSGS